MSELPNANLNSGKDPFRQTTLIGPGRADQYAAELERLARHSLEFQIVGNSRNALPRNQ